MTRPVDRFMNQCLVQEALTSIAAAVPDHERCAVAMLVTRQLLELAYAAGARDGAADMGEQISDALKTIPTERAKA